MAGRIRFSGKEIYHLFISVLVMGFLVAINISGGVGQISNAAGFIKLLTSEFPIAILIIAPAFVLHELGHKVVAQKFGFWAEYRMWVWGLAMAVFFTILGFLFIAPGAVYFAQRGFERVSAEKIGKIGLVGAAINLIIGVCFGLIAALSTNAFLSGIFTIAASVNAFLAIFNLIPISPLDGEKVFAWNRKIWAAAISLAVVLFIFLGAF